MTFSSFNTQKLKGLQLFRYLFGEVICLRNFSLSDISSFIILLGSLVGAGYVIWEKLLQPITAIGKRRIQRREEQRKAEIRRDIAPVIAESLSVIKEDFEDLNKKVSDMMYLNMEQSANINSLDKKIDDNEIDRIRWDILNFASALRQEIDATEDEFKHIFELHDKYVALLETTGRVNGLIDIEFKYIQHCFLQKFDKI